MPPSSNQPLSPNREEFPMNQGSSSESRQSDHAHHPSPPGPFAPGARGACESQDDGAKLSPSLEPAQIEALETTTSLRPGMAFAVSRATMPVVTLGLTRRRRLDGTMLAGAGRPEPSNRRSGSRMATCPPVAAAVAAAPRRCRRPLLLVLGSAGGTSTGGTVYCPAESWQSRARATSPSPAPTRVAARRGHDRRRVAPPLLLRRVARGAARQPGGDWRGGCGVLATSLPRRRRNAPAPALAIVTRVQKPCIGLTFSSREAVQRQPSGFGNGGSGNARINGSGADAIVHCRQPAANCVISSRRSNRFPT